MWDNCPVTDIVPGDTVRIITSKGEVLAKNVILTVGPWAQKWANKLNLQHLSFKVFLYFWQHCYDRNFFYNLFQTIKLVSFPVL